MVPQQPGSPSLLPQRIPELCRILKGRSKQHKSCAEPAPAHIHLIDQTLRVWTHFLLVIFCLSEGFSTWPRFQSSLWRGSTQPLPLASPGTILIQHQSGLPFYFLFCSIDQQNHPSRPLAHSPSQEQFCLLDLLHSAVSKFSFYHIIIFALYNSSFCLWQW